MSKARILIIDDDRDFTASAKALLESDGYEIELAHDGKQGLEKFTARPPDLVVLDIMMRHPFEGYEVNQAIKYGSAAKTARDIPVVMVSSVPYDPTERFMWAGELDMITPDRYFVKPLDIVPFLDTVRELIEKVARE